MELKIHRKPLIKNTSAAVKIFFLLFFVFSTQLAFCDDSTETSKINQIILNIEKAIIDENNAEILKYVPASGAHFGDGHFRRDEIKKLIKNKNSWLFKHLYTGNGSIKKYFQRAKDLNIKITCRSENSIQVIFASSNYEPEQWIECCFMKLNKNWYFDGIFYCG